MNQLINQRSESRMAYLNLKKYLSFLKSNLAKFLSQNISNSCVPQSTPIKTSIQGSFTILLRVHFGLLCVKICCVILDLEVVIYPNNKIIHLTLSHNLCLTSYYLYKSSTQLKIVHHSVALCDASPDTRYKECFF